MRCEYVDVLGEEEIRALAHKWWGNASLPQHYFDALKEAARLGAERALQSGNSPAVEDEWHPYDATAL